MEHELKYKLKKKIYIKIKTSKILKVIKNKVLKNKYYS